jgi:hypothetical protein
VLLLLGLHRAIFGASKRLEDRERAEERAFELFPARYQHSMAHQSSASASTQLLRPSWLHRLESLGSVRLAALKRAIRDELNIPISVVPDEAVRHPSLTCTQVVSVGTLPDGTALHRLTCCTPLLTHCAREERTWPMLTSAPSPSKHRIGLHRTRGRNALAPIPRQCFSM